jgi:uncharacterized membrane protein YjjB (DUF3815 family)
MHFLFLSYTLNAPGISSSTLIISALYCNEDHRGMKIQFEKYIWSTILQSCSQGITGLLISRIYRKPAGNKKHWKLN